MEIFFNGTWGSICGWTFTNTDATVLCKQLNYTHGIYVSSHSYGITQGPLWVKRMTCAGHETSLYQCALSGLGEAEKDSPICSGHDFDVGIKCYTNGESYCNKFGSVCISLMVNMYINNSLNRIFHQTYNTW